MVDTIIKNDSFLDAKSIHVFAWAFQIESSKKKSKFLEFIESDEKSTWTRRTFDVIDKDGKIGYN